MLFNSLEFALFFPLVFVFYWLVFNRKYTYQNVFLLASSCFFYGWWDVQFLLLIALNTTVDFFIGLALNSTKKEGKRTALLLVSICINIGLLGFFKYYNFFIDAFVQSFELFGKSISVNRLNILLPVGISFYTFQTLSYTLDIYFEKIEPTPNYLKYASFVSFFPLLLAGPIERASNMLPQLGRKREFEYGKMVVASRQILWGLFKKMVIADNAAVFVNDIFQNYETYNSATLLLGVILFAFQVYGDFSGYSDIAVGIAGLLGFEVTQNFRFPYFSRSIGELWKRWHISLTTWLNDYVFTPLAFSWRSAGKKGTFLAVFITFLISGFWHGAEWHYVAWGAFWGFSFLPILVKSSVKSPFSVNISEPPQLKDIHRIVFTFGWICLGGLLFRADSLDQAFYMIYKMVNPHFWDLPEVRPFELIGLVIGFVWLEWKGRSDNFGIENILNFWPKWLRWSFYYMLRVSIFWWGANSQEFIYFQF